METSSGTLSPAICSCLTQLGFGENGAFCSMLSTGSNSFRECVCVWGGAVTDTACAHTVRGVMKDLHEFIQLLS